MGFRGRGRVGFGRMRVVIEGFLFGGGGVRGREGSSISAYVSLCLSIGRIY